MIVDNLNVVRIARLPAEDNPPLVIDSDTMNPPQVTP